MPGREKSSSRARAFPQTTAGRLHPNPVQAICIEKEQIQPPPYLGISPSAVSTIDSINLAVLNTVSEGIFCSGPSGAATFVNPAAANMLGWSPEELIGKNLHDLVHHSYPDGKPYPMEACPILSAFRTGRTEHCEDEVFWRKDGTSFAVSYTSTPSPGEGAVVVFRDISEQMRRDRWQRSKDAVFHAINTQQPLDATLQLLADAYSLYQPGCSIAVLLRAQEGEDFLSLVAGSRLSKSLEAELRTVRIEENLSACGRAAYFGIEVLADSGDSLPAKPQFIETPGNTGTRCLALPIISVNGQVLGVVAFLAVTASAASPSSTVNCTKPHSLPIALALPVALHLPGAVAEHGGFRGVRDLAQIAIEHRNLQSELLHQSRHDRLTGLPNWLLIEERMIHLLRAADHDRSRVAVCTVDLDRFRRVNENHGHVAGDDLLQQIAGRFKRILRKTDTLGRQGGDEFIVVIPDLNDPSDADIICRKLLSALNEPFLIDGKSVTVAANIGISIYPDHADTPELLVQHADTALDFAKEKGKASLKVFRPDLGQKVRQLAEREAALQTALQNNELYLMYQPLFDANRQIHGFEALLRWQHPKLGMIPPDQFIPLAEDTGLILPIGDWVLREACRQAMSWNIKALSDTKIFVNISALQLGESDFTHSVGYALRLSGLPPSRLELEVTESFIVPSFKKATLRLQPLKDLGVSIAIDDFGTGHSSFSVLHKLPIDAIKVDRSFVSRIDKDPSGLSTVRAIINLAHQLGMKTVAEGVETEAQFNLLNDMQCDFYQGYLLSKPLTVEGVHQTFAELDSPSANKSRMLKSRASGEKVPELRKSA